MTTPTNDPTTLTLPSEREIVITRVFDAPRNLVFEAWTKPEHVAHWYGQPGSTMAVCEIDLRVGGRWRYVLKADDGGEYAFSGVYQEIVPPEKLVYSEGFEAMPGHECIVTAVFSEQNGKTLLTSTLLYQNRDDRDGHINSGMEPGMRAALSRLESYVQALR